jgi:hypothetical protein
MEEREAWEEWEASAESVLQRTLPHSTEQRKAAVVCTA